MKNRQILFNNFKAEYALYRDELDDAVFRVLESGWYLLGNELQAFEEEFAGYVGARYAVGVANGTDAITLALLSRDIGQGDEVITTNMTAYPTIVGIERAGATPVLVEIEPDTGLIDGNIISDAVTSRTRAIVPVHIYGQSCNLDDLQTIAKKHSLDIIEDCAQSVGATYKDITTGTVGIVNAFSFYPTKNLGAYGDAGALTTNSKQIYEKLLSLRNYGQSKRYYHDTIGLNSRLDEIQAAILRVKLKHLPAAITRRREIAKMYDQGLSVGSIPECEDRYHTYHLYVIMHPERDKLLKHLSAHSIPALIHYPVPIHKQKAYSGPQKRDTFPITEQFCNSILSLPIHPMLTDDDVRFIIKTVNKYKP